ncbi:uncharacterized protein TRIADDRAFT_51423 [Trichoplax adhaerens]|uniref:Ubiquitin carboxyl-terminal hydrolase MINDY n=1 Tax=Trichoplax adhaerens TaxID=10228 RepID=B3RIZ3_TRIAD|nr:hypothetical protein TRIADDRAFT_51423 [Trichoplax adhaerens]EDV28476.1 hypothetical protein TRIADDRAFT_51423 [Trichoplax adhaerens]|eukprot:XP_002107678.1 hypothetical protein TRIADDRAFT_51423 [Trichoplax adhaerens]
MTETIQSVVAHVDQQAMQKLADTLEIEANMTAILSLDERVKLKLKERARIEASARFSASYQKYKTISLTDSLALRKILFGQLMVPKEIDWCRESFIFHIHNYGLPFGLKIHKNGPCGVIAVVQAFVLRHLIFDEDDENNYKRLKAVNERERQNALALALADILWIAGEESKTAIVLLPPDDDRSKPIGASQVRLNDMTEDGILYQFNAFNDLRDFIKKKLPIFQHEFGYGVAFFLYSAILSRGIENIRNDMDDPEKILLTENERCSQELINLLLVGKAVSYVFNGILDYDYKLRKPLQQPLFGIDKRGVVGLLTLMEHVAEGNYTVGSKLKTPKYPIWVVNIELSFAVIFSCKRDLLNDWKAERQFHLWYYTGLVSQTELQRIHIDTLQTYMPKNKDNVEPLINHCIRTKWSGVKISSHSSISK